MSELGQKAKYSLRADVFRFAPDSGLMSDIAGGPFSAKPGHSALSVSTADLSNRSLGTGPIVLLSDGLPVLSRAAAARDR